MRGRRKAATGFGRLRQATIPRATRTRTIARTIDRYEIAGAGRRSWNETNVRFEWGVPRPVGGSDQAGVRHAGAVRHWFVNSAASLGRQRYL